MSGKTTNHGLIQLELNDNANFPQLLNDTFKRVDKGLTLDVGTSTGTENNYILDIGSITLTEGNKGISFKFFADKDSDGAVTINTNYNLIKPNKNPVKNLKSGAPYIITYDGGSNFFLASGADESDSTSVGTDGSNVKTEITFIGTDGEVHTGTFTADGTMVESDLLSGKVGYSKGNKITGAMTNNGTKTASLNCGGNYIIPEGYHNGSGKVTANSLASQTSATATAVQILSGYTAWVNGKKITGNATIENLGGKKFAQGSVSKVINNTQIYDIDINLGFKPSVLIIENENVLGDMLCVSRAHNVLKTRVTTTNRDINVTVSITDTGIKIYFKQGGSVFSGNLNFNYLAYS